MAYRRIASATKDSSLLFLTGCVGKYKICSSPFGRYMYGPRACEKIHQCNVQLLAFICHTSRYHGLRSFCLLSAGAVAPLILMPLVSKVALFLLQLLPVGLTLYIWLTTVTLRFCP